MHRLIVQPKRYDSPGLDRTLNLRQCCLPCDTVLFYLLVGCPIFLLHYARILMLLTPYEDWAFKALITDTDPPIHRICIALLGSATGVCKKARQKEETRTEGSNTSRCACGVNAAGYAEGCGWRDVRKGGTSTDGNYY
ncbi:uncharacterized protein ARMOST_17733 [Armillaria ostoyae]|uniref:Uncharacterized protein n=1 Tax=Armillaria ostoyae TaxID=47428 RepID=A0A284RZY0_ARMOS|nr:uncharacterized protein ARMOST_17733 [Armillaria ostoyae]